MRVTTDQIEKLESYFTNRFKELLDGKMLHYHRYQILIMFQLILILSLVCLLCIVMKK